MTRATCTTDKCRRWKNLDKNGVCPIHTTANPVGNQEVCSKCSLIVNDVDPAISCDLCDKWCHLDCSDIDQELYALIDPTDKEPPKGIKWFCENCSSAVDKIIKSIKSNKDAETETTVQNKSTQFDGVKVPICEDYRHGTCAHGLSGKNIVNGNSCPYKHPKKCQRYCRSGNDPNHGCINAECRFLHPILCRNSLRRLFCDEENCTYTHLKGTQRRNRKPYTYQGNETPNTRRAQTWLVIPILKDLTQDMVMAET